MEKPYVSDISPAQAGKSSGLMQNSESATGQAFLITPQLVDAIAAKVYELLKRDIQFEQERRRAGIKRQPMKGLRQR